MGKNPAEKAKNGDPNAKVGTRKSSVKTGTGAGQIEKKVKARSVGEIRTTKPRSEKHCKIEGCKRVYRAKGYCRVHYKKWRRGEYGRARYRTCHEEACFTPMIDNRHGYCHDHYQKCYVKGQKAPIPTEKSEPAKEKVATS